MLEQWFTLFLLTFMDNFNSNWYVQGSDHILITLNSIFLRYLIHLNFKYSIISYS